MAIPATKNLQLAGFIDPSSVRIPLSPPVRISSLHGFWGCWWVMNQNDSLYPGFPLRTLRESLREAASRQHVHERVRDPDLSSRDQVLVLVAPCAVPVAAANLQAWTECRNKAYFNEAIRDLHRVRLVEASEAGTVRLLPPGTAEASRLRTWPTISKRRRTQYRSPSRIGWLGFCWNNAG